MAASVNPEFTMSRNVHFDVSVLSPIDTWFVTERP